MARSDEPSGQSSTGRRRSWSPARIIELGSTVASPQIAFVDTHAAPEETFVIAGSGRSGTTWIAELCNPGDRRVIWEPFNTLYSPLPARAGFHWGERVDPDESAPTLARAFARVLDGRVRSRWTDHRNTLRFATRRMVKTVATTNLLPWLHVRFPAVRVIYVVRHPFAFAASHRALDWPLMDQVHLQLVGGADAVIAALPRPVRGRARAVDLAPADPFERYVVRWCLENATQLHTPVPGVLPVRYERLVLDTRPELDRIGEHLGIGFGDDVVRRAQVPSATDFRNSAGTAAATGSKDALVAGWSTSVDRAHRDAGRRILDAFGLADRFEAA